MHTYLQKNNRFNCLCYLQVEQSAYHGNSVHKNFRGFEILMLGWTYTSVCRVHTPPAMVDNKIWDACVEGKRTLQINS